MYGNYSLLDKGVLASSGVSPLLTGAKQRHGTNKNKLRRLNSYLFVQAHIFTQVCVHLCIMTVIKMRLFEGGIGVAARRRKEM